MKHQIGIALQRLRNTPGFTAVALASLAAGMGLNILIFSITSPALIKSLPYPNEDRLLDVSMAPPGKPETRGPLTPALYALLRDRTGAAFEAVGVFDGGRTANLAGDAGGPAERVNAHQISATGLAALGAKPLHGRLPLAADEQPDAAPSMVLGYPLWQRRFGGRAEVVNQTVNVDGQPTLVLGVMPEGFGLLDNSSDAWFTSSFAPAPGQETQHAVRGIGRLKPGVSMADAQAAVKIALDEYAQQFPTRDKGWTVELTPWREARFGGLRMPLTLVQLAVGVILLLVCVSVAVLLRARTAVTGPGQPRPDGVLAEGMLLALGGGAIAVVVTALGLPALLDITPRAIPRLDDVAFDAGVVAFSVGLCIVTGLVIGIVPAWRASQPVAGSAAGTGGYGWGGRISATVLVVLLTVQVALAFVLLAGASLAFRAIGDLQGRDVGINPSGLLSADVHLPRSPYVTPNVAKVGSIDINEYSPAGAALYDRIRAALQTTSGVVQAAGVGNQPFSNAPFVQGFLDDLEHTPDNQVAAQYLAVTENYFNTMGIRLVGGRDFSSTDGPDSPWVVLVNETMAKQHWPNGDAIGHKVTLTFQPNDEEPAREVVGIVADTLPFRGASEVPPLIYLLHRQQAVQQRASLEGRRTVMSFIVRTTGDPLALGDAVKAAVGRVDVTTPVTAIRTVESYLNAGQIALLQFAAAILGIFALVGLVAGVAGVYGLTAYGVRQRRNLLTLALRAVVAVGIGVAVGLAGWLRLASIIASFLTNLTITPSDPKMLVVAGGVLVATALVAFLVPVVSAPRTGR